METTLKDLTTLLTTAPGALIYHLGLLVALMAAMQVNQLGQRAGLSNKRVSTTLLLVLLIQLALLILNALAWQSLLNPQPFLPPFDRLSTFLPLLLLSWAFLFPQRSKVGDAVAFALAFAGIGFFIYSTIEWAGNAAFTGFNLSFAGIVWQFAIILLAAFGLGLTFIFRPRYWGALAAFLLLHGLGAVLDYSFQVAGHFPVFLRLACLSAFPILPFLAAGSSVAHQAQPPQPADAPAVQLAPEERKKQAAYPRLVTAFLELAAEDDSGRLTTRLTRALAQATFSDLCFHVQPPDAFNQLHLVSGYDMIRDEQISPATLHTAAVPNLASAVTKSRPIRQNDPTSLPDSKSIAAAIGLRESGSLLFLPVAAQETNHGGFLFLSPYSARTWTEDELDGLASYNEILVRFLNRVKNLSEIKSQLVNAQDAITQLNDELNRLKSENERLAVELTALSQSSDGASQAAELSALRSEHRKALETIQQLKNEVAALQNRLKNPSETGQDPEGQLEVELRLTLEEVARLQNQLAEANSKILSLEQQRQTPGKENSEEREVVASIVQELRQPMSSITGYTDLLLGESVGILGALQRKFLERIKASGERMRALMDDLLQITAIQDEQLEILPQPVDLAAVIDQAIADTSAQLREKNIALQVDLPDELPQIHADRDAIQQILIHLLRNAGAASPTEGTVRLHVRTEEQAQNEKFLLVEVMDSGCGIAADDLPKVFARRYRADNALIPGVGDSGVGLSIAKALVEAHGGRIWVDSVIDKGATFSVLLPLNPNPDSASTGNHGDAKGTD